jgi:DNA (cytosine-5)-methyltransferase 1
MMKILNLYAGLGGNRKLWEGCDVTAVENEPKIAAVYQRLHPNDTVIVGDAHAYLLEHADEFDFIWSSPPCQTHSRMMKATRHKRKRYSDLSLYQEILFLQHFYKGRWVVENVKPYYKTLIEPTITLQRHLFWSNLNIKTKEFEKDNIRTAQIPDLQKKYGYDLSNYKLKNKRQILRNCVSPELGQHILNS